MKVVYGNKKFVKFNVEVEFVDGIALNYSFLSLVEDIRQTSHVQYLACTIQGRRWRDLHRSGKSTGWKDS